MDLELHGITGSREQRIPSGGGRMQEERRTISPRREVALAHSSYAPLYCDWGAFREYLDGWTAVDYGDL